MKIETIRALKTLGTQVSKFMQTSLSRKAIRYHNKLNINFLENKHLSPQFFFKVIVFISVIYNVLNFQKKADILTFLKS